MEIYFIIFSVCLTSTTVFWLVIDLSRSRGNPEDAIDAALINEEKRAVIARFGGNTTIPVVTPRPTATPSIFPVVSTSGSPTTSSTTTSAPASPSHHLSSDKIAGAAVGAAIGLAALLGLLAFFFKFRRRTPVPASTEDSAPTARYPSPGVVQPTLIGPQGGGQPGIPPSGFGQPELRSGSHFYPALVPIVPGPAAHELHASSYPPEVHSQPNSNMLYGQSWTSQPHPQSRMYDMPAARDLERNSSLASQPTTVGVGSYASRNVAPGDDETTRQREARKLAQQNAEAEMVQSLSQQHAVIQFRVQPGNEQSREVGGTSSQELE